MKRYKIRFFCHDLPNFALDNPKQRQTSLSWPEADPPSHPHHQIHFSVPFWRSETYPETVGAEKLLIRWQMTIGHAVVIADLGVGPAANTHTLLNSSKLSPSPHHKLLQTFWEEWQLAAATNIKVKIICINDSDIKSKTYSHCWV